MPTKVFNHSVEVYAKLEEKGIQATEGHVFEGSLRAVVLDAGIGLDYYQRVRNLLADLECIRYLRTGHGKTPSLIHLIKAPTLEIYNEYRNSNKGGRGKHSNDELMLGRIADVVRRMDNLEAEMRTLNGIVRNFVTESSEDNDDD